MSALKRQLFGRIALGTATAAALAASMSQSVSASSQSDQIAQQVDNVAPAGVGAPLTLQDAGGAITSQAAPADAEDPAATSNSYTASKSVNGNVQVSNGDGTPLSVGLPDVAVQTPVVAGDDVTAVYPAASTGNTALAIQTFEDGARIHTVLANASAPTSFAYPVSVPSGGNIEDLGGGMLSINDSAGEAIGYVNSPWARDANGTAVPTRFEIVGSSVIQHVDHRSSNFTYPVVADPFLGKSLVKSAKWSWRNNQWTLKVTPTGWSRFNAGSYGVGKKGWKELRSKYGSKGLNYNLGGMKDQYICHQQAAFFKPTWNLDEKRKNVSYAKTVAKLCNPAWMAGHNP